MIMLSESQRKRARDLADQLERLGDIGWTNDPEISLRAGAMLNACDFLRSLAAQDTGESGTDCGAPAITRASYNQSDSQVAHQHESGGVEGNARYMASGSTGAPSAEVTPASEKMAEADKGGNSFGIRATSLTPGSRQQEESATAGIKPCPLSPQWISVKDRLPTKHGDYLVAFTETEEGPVFVADDLWYGNWWIDTHTGKVSHWMPLPPAPDEE